MTAGDSQTQEGNTSLDRKLSARHLQFIAIGGTIGTGLFLGIGPALAKAGPASLLLAFLLIGLVSFSVMTALAEMAAYMPVTGAFTVYASRFIDPSMGFAMGWILLISWSLTLAVELVAAGLIIQYWNADLNVGIWIAVFLLVFTAVNLLPIRWFGELEMWFSLIKVVFIVGFVIFAACFNAGGTGDKGYIGFKYWHSPGAFAQYLVPGPAGSFVGFWAVLVTAGFTYQGTELVAIGAGETRDPAKEIPSAIRWTYYGIVTLFLATVFFVGIDVPFNDPGLTNSDAQNASASPLVIIANLAGVQSLSHVINAVLLTAVLSAANSDIYSSSRIMIALADEGHAPAWVRRTNRYGTPYWAVLFCSSFGLLGFLNLTRGGEIAFIWLLNITAIAGFVTWALINFCHLRFMTVLRSRGQSRDTLPYKAPFQPWLSIFGLVLNLAILLTSGFTVFIQWSTGDFFASYISVFIFIVFFAGHKLICRTKPVNVRDVVLPTS
ncbi:hypothetical protein XA68_16638 [Ophiocordyceps unilateralis]|uniref:Amino acid permease/ SLC12A domain-containing protein n=1 Tax=Ophiocordyceps unilateralis TaxID=268505 RepID=A0A2A9PPB1_OPHUN|nr:hypothetical protein XA68_16638 [Ophiocordyceps unilateralis]